MEPIPPAAREQVAAQVRSVVAKKKRTQTEISAAIGMSQQALSRRMNGNVSFEVDVMLAIAKFLNVPLAEILLSEEDERVCMNSVSMTFSPA